MSVGLCFNFHLSPEECIVSGERGLGYVTGYSGCHEGEDMGPPEGTMDPELAQWLLPQGGQTEVEEPEFEQQWVQPLGGTEDPMETMDPELAQWLAPGAEKTQ